MRHRGRLLLVIGAAAVLVTLSLAGAAGSLPANPWTGIWDAGGGRILTLNQGGSSITGTSPRDCDRNPTGTVIKGNVTSPDGSKASFTYSGKPACPGEEGKFDAVMSADARSVKVTGVTQYGTGFTSTWTYIRGGTEPRTEAPTRISFLFTQGGRLPEGAPSFVVEMLTAGRGSARLINKREHGSRVTSELGRLDVRVVREARTAESPSAARRRVRLLLVERPGTKDRGYYLSEDGVTLRIPLVVASSTDDRCPSEASAPRLAELDLYDGRGNVRDALRLSVAGCRHQSLMFRGGLGYGRKSPVKVVIIEN